MTPLALDIVATRGAHVESRHLVHAAVVAPDGTVRAQVRDPHCVTYWRSCAKPFQVMPFLEGGGFDAAAWGARELALACASHGGEPEHVALAAGMLGSLGLEEGDLACGPHEPLSARGARLVRESGERITRLHNNCSGKHAAMLGAARMHGAPTQGYERPDHAVQAACARAVSIWTGVPVEQLWVAVDGCGVPVFGLSLVHMALAYARLADAARRGHEVPSRILAAIQAHPVLLGGTDRFDTVLLEETGGRIFAKVGAEGVHTVAILDQGLGLALKVEDGAQRAQQAAVLLALQQLGALPAELPPRLQEFLVRPVRNTRGESVGEVGPAVRFA
ncbi:MAG: asparaginase [Gemmatimonadetes bacterium]|nr:asparaginase [Gemmatimonadota bacterium]